MKKLNLNITKNKIIIEIIISIILVSLLGAIVFVSVDSKLKHDAEVAKLEKEQDARSYAVEVTAITNHKNMVIFEDNNNNMWIYESPNVKLKDTYVLILDSHNTVSSRDDTILKIVADSPSTANTPADWL